MVIKVTEMLLFLCLFTLLCHHFLVVVMAMQLTILALFTSLCKMTSLFIYI